MWLNALSKIISKSIIMNGMEVLGAISIVPAIYAFSRYNRSSRLFIQMLSILAFGYIIGLGVRHVKSLLNKAETLKEVYYDKKQAMGIHDLSFVAIMENIEYAQADPGLPESYHSYASLLPKDDRQRKEKWGCGGLGYYNTS
jgi:hypothetical protein